MCHVVILALQLRAETGSSISDVQTDRHSGRRLVCRLSRAWPIDLQPPEVAVANADTDANSIETDNGTGASTDESGPDPDADSVQTDGHAAAAATNPVTGADASSGKANADASASSRY